MAKIQNKLHTIYAERTHLEAALAKSLRELRERTEENGVLLGELLRARENEALRLNEVQMVYNSMSSQNKDNEDQSATKEIFRRQTWQEGQPPPQHIASIHDYPESDAGGKRASMDMSTLPPFPRDASPSRVTTEEGGGSHRPLSSRSSASGLLERFPPKGVSTGTSRRAGGGRPRGGPSRIRVSAQKHQGTINAMVVSPRTYRCPNGLIATAGMDGSFIMSEILDGKPPHTFFSFQMSPRGTPEPIVTMDLSPDQSASLWGCSDGALYAFNIATKKIRATLLGHSSGISGCGFYRVAPPYSHVYSTSLDRTLKLWDIGEQQCLQTCSSNSAIHCSAKSPDCEYLVTGHRNGNIEVWNISQNACESIRSLELDNIPITGVTFSADGMQLLAQTKDGSLRIVDFRSMRVSDSLVGMKSAGRTCAVFSPDQRHIVCGAGTNLSAWDVSRAALSGTVSAVSPITCLSWVMPVLVSAHQSGIIAVWEH
eukprot:GHVO01012657.1.p1 GENE.GHVO01012657.1~~GHVO01012657.1.p1  ORF type:complete len:484 (+),score=81.55 GHVO01012657.1:582-2033(+)